MQTHRAESSELPVREKARRARSASRRLATLSDARRRELLEAVARALSASASDILSANEIDVAAADADVANGKMSRAMFNRLRTNKQGVAEMAARVREVAALPDPIGRRLAATELDDGLTLIKESCPLGVVAVVFESRPDVIPQVASLALKSGNAVLLKGGSEAANTNEMLVSIWRSALSQFDDVSPDAVNMLRSRDDVAEMLELEDEIDLVVPRGSREFVRSVAERSRIPVLGHGEGVCHVFVDRSADLEKAWDISFDSKVQYPSACNAAETLLVHEDVAEEFLPEMMSRFASASVEARGCPRTVALLSGQGVVPATEADWRTEYSDLCISIRVVADIDEAINHIDCFGSRHTESIVTEDRSSAERFMNEVDAAGVYWNASTRFADGFRYGLGAELGISTGKLHARGPVGLEGLTTYKYKLVGNGHTVASYSSGERKFKHRPLM
jgi:glutamate-5-semialdehyde dehydrogenase